MHTHLFRSGISSKWIHLLFGMDLTSSNFKSQIMQVPYWYSCLKVVYKRLQTVLGIRIKILTQFSLKKKKISLNFSENFSHSSTVLCCALGLQEAYDRLQCVWGVCLEHLTSGGSWLQIMLRTDLKGTRSCAEVWAKRMVKLQLPPLSSCYCWPTKIQRTVLRKDCWCYLFGFQ